MNLYANKLKEEATTKTTNQLFSFYCFFAFALCAAHCVDYVNFEKKEKAMEGEGRNNKISQVSAAVEAQRGRRCRKKAYARDQTEVRDADGVAAGQTVELFHIVVYKQLFS